MLNETPRRIPTIGFVSLGCAKALVDSERVITELRSEGYSIVDNYRDSDLVIVNTCGFINEAIEESLGAIAEATRENGRVIVMGCLGGKKDADGTNFVMKRNPAVLGVLGPEEEKDVVKLVHQHLPAPHAPYLDLVPGGGVRLTPQHYAYLKISEGCNNHCTFCIIPQLRGKLHSRSMDSIMREAWSLKEDGVKEIMVIAEDTSAYGSDFGYKLAFAGGRPVHIFRNLHFLVREGMESHHEYFVRRLHKRLSVQSQDRNLNVVQYHIYEDRDTTSNPQDLSPSLPFVYLIRLNVLHVENHR